jgi:hypothetical protein
MDFVIFLLLFVLLCGLLDRWATGSRQVNR